MSSEVSKMEITGVRRINVCVLQDKEVTFVVATN
jgi:hypothetical protein